MYSTLIKMINKPMNTKDVILSSNLITPDEVQNSLSNTALSNNLAVEITSSMMAKSSNSIIKIIYSIIKENPYAIFLFVVITVFAFTIILRIILYIFTYSKYNSKRNMMQKIWKSFLSANFIWIGFILGITVGVDVLPLPLVIAHFIKGCFLSILLWILYIIIQKILHLYTRGILIFRSQGTRIKFFKNKNVFIVFARAIHITWFLIFISIFLGLWGVELGPILAGLGIVGIVVGLALQDTLSHILGGVALMLDETYSEGDYVILDNQDEGTIFQIGYRSTKLRTLDEEFVIIPNGILSKMVIKNLSQPIKRMRVTTFYSTYAGDAPPEKVKELLLLAVKKTPSILKYPEPYVFFLEPKGSQYKFRLNFYVNSPMTRLSNTDFVQQEIVKLFHENNINFSPEESIMHVSSMVSENITQEDK